MLEVAIISKQYTSGLGQDYEILFELLKNTYKVVKLENPSSYKEVYIKIFLEHIEEKWMNIKSKYTYFIPNHEMLTDWDVKFMKQVDKVLCKTQYTYNVLSHPNKVLTKFTSICSKSTAKKDYSLFIHFGGTSYMKNTLQLLKLWVENNCFLDVDKNIKLLFTHKPSFNKNVINFWKSLNPTEQKSCLNRTIDCEKYKNIYYLKFLSGQDYNYFSIKAGIRIQPSLTEGYGQTINEGRCNKSLTITVDAPPMNELSDITIKAGKKIPCYEIFKPFKNRYKYAYRGKSNAYYMDNEDFSKFISNIIKLSIKDKEKIALKQHQEFLNDTKFFKDIITELFGLDNSKIVKSHPISKEYHNWKLVSKILDNLKKSCKGNKKLEYEISNILERYILSRYINGKNDTSILEKASEEIVEKHIIDNTDKAFIFFKKNVTDILDKKKEIKTVSGGCSLTPDYISFREFKKPINSEQYEYFKNYKLDSVVKCALRYGSLISKGQQWSMPSSQYNHLYNNYNVRCEGFASPFNSKLIGKPESKFCSLFKDTDAVFGSIGDFFKTNMVEEAECWAVNPPFIEQVLFSSAKHIIKNMSTGKKLFVFYIMPGWFDSNTYEILNQSKYTKYKKVLNKNKYFYEYEGKKIIARFNSVVFVLDNYSNNLYNGICKGMF